MPDTPEERVGAAKHNVRRYMGYSLRMYLFLFLALILSLIAASIDQRWLILPILAGTVYLIARDWKRTRGKLRKV